MYATSSANNATTSPVMASGDRKRARLPRTIPTAPKSASEKVVLAKPMAPRTGSSRTGRKVISRPLAKAPIIAPRRPPVALPNTPAVAPVKKCGTTPGRISTQLN